MKGNPSPLPRRLALLLAGAALLGTLVLGVSGLEGRADREALVLAEQSVRRAAVQCYALEGFYPPDLAYLEAHYGVAIDKSRCFVDYRYIASNLVPDITVLPRQGAG